MDRAEASSSALELSGDDLDLQEHPREANMPSNSSEAGDSDTAMDKDEQWDDAQERDGIRVGPYYSYDTFFLH